MMGLYGVTALINLVCFPSCSFSCPPQPILWTPLSEKIWDPIQAAKCLLHMSVGGLPCSSVCSDVMCFLAELESTRSHLGAEMTSAACAKVIIFSSLSLTVWGFLPWWPVSRLEHHPQRRDPLRGKQVSLCDVTERTPLVTPVQPFSMSGLEVTSTGREVMSKVGAGYSIYQNGLWFKISGRLS